MSSKVCFRPGQAGLQEAVRPGRPHERRPRDGLEGDGGEGEQEEGGKVGVRARHVLCHKENKYSIYLSFF